MKFCKSFCSKKFNTGPFCKKKIQCPRISYVRSARLAYFCIYPRPPREGRLMTSMTSIKILVAFVVFLWDRANATKNLSCES